MTRAANLWLRVFSPRRPPGPPSPRPHPWGRAACPLHQPAVKSKRWMIGRGVNRIIVTKRRLCDIALSRVLPFFCNYSLFSLRQINKVIKTEMISSIIGYVRKVSTVKTNMIKTVAQNWSTCYIKFHSFNITLFFQPRDRQNCNLW